MSPYLKDDETISVMAASLRRFNFFDQLFRTRGPAKLALTQAGFAAHETERLVDAAILYERRRRDAFGVRCAARSVQAQPFAALAPPLPVHGERAGVRGLGTDPLRGAA